MKTRAIIYSLLTFCVAIFTLLNIGCATSKAVAAKSGAQLWGENCQRCHNTPSPATYSDDQWDIIGEHMRIKANLTDTEVSKIVTFLKSAN